MVVRFPHKEECLGSIPSAGTNPRSSNGRTSPFGGEYLGSNPGQGAIKSTHSYLHRMHVSMFALHDSWRKPIRNYQSLSECAQ
jgi:hypothetical protein